MTSTIAVPHEVLLKFNEVKAQEAARIKKKITNDEFLIYLTKLYKRVGGDTFVLDAAWEGVKAEGKR